MSGDFPHGERRGYDRDVEEWSDIAYEMWAMLCNSTTDGHSAESDWNAARDRLRDRFHAALAKLHEND